MQSKPLARNAARLRRWIGAGVCLAGLAVVVLVVPRLSPRSPLAIVVLCALAILTMKLVERRVRQWFTRWAERQASRTSGSKGPL